MLDLLAMGPLDHYLSFECQNFKSFNAVIKSSSHYRNLFFDPGVRQR